MVIQRFFSDIVKADPYPGLTIVKGECIGHVQKRVGTRLRNFKKNMAKKTRFEMVNNLVAWGA